MSSSMLARPFGRTVFLVLLLITSAIGIFFSVLIPDLASFNEQGIQVGDVVAQDILAPYALTYESELLTEKQRQTVESNVAPIFTPVDPGIARSQLEKLRGALTFISSVRADHYARLEQKMNDLAALEEIRLSRDTAEELLLLSDSRWQTVQQEAVLTLERVMRETIHDDRLEEVRRFVPASVSLALPEEQARVVAELVAAFLAPNSFYNKELTEAARQQARQAVEPVLRTFAAEETIIARGRVITPLEMEALQQFGLVQPQQQWQKVGSAAMLAMLVVVYFVVYQRRSRRLLESMRAVVIFTMLFMVFLLGARLVIPGHTVLPYLYPTAAFGLTVAVMFSQELALISILPLGILIAYGLPNALDFTLYMVLSSFFGVLALQRVHRLLSFLWAGLVVAVSGMITVVLYRLPQPNTDWMGLVTLAAAAALYGLASAGLSVVLQYFIAQAMRRTTPLQLIELSRPDHPLLQLMLRTVPGTYQHSLQVANLAEQAAERIGADTLLVRVGALYHDAGKALNPYYFIENQLPGDLNPHDDLDPVISAATIIQHVTDGLKLAQQYHLPRRLQDFISEHHGTMIARYQYNRAMQRAEAAEDEAEAVDEEKFRYPGPKPQSRETALLMLADGCEARVRAEHPENEAALRIIVQEVFQNRLSLGQLDDTTLTLRDLNRIIESFVTTLRGVYHPRIEYPKLAGETGALSQANIVPDGQIPEEIPPPTPPLPQTGEIHPPP